jgi:predicted aldo/keto reductase-like oxidoreductase
LARERFLELAPAHTAVKCADCPGCTVQCPHGVNVVERLTKAQNLFAC